MQFLKTPWVLLVFSAVLCLHTQQKVAPPAAAAEGKDLAFVDVIVTDSKGNLVNGLSAKDFGVLDEDVPREIVHLSQNEIPLAIALLIPNSEFPGPSASKPLQEALASTLTTLNAEDRVSLFSFSEGYKFEIGLTGDIKAIVRRVGDFYVRSGDNVNDAVYYTADYLRGKARKSRRVIILVGNTRTIGPVLGTSPKDVERSLINGGVALFLIRPGLQIYEPGFVTPDEFAHKSGGLVVDVSPNGYQDGFASLIRILKSRYTLCFHPGPGAKPGTIRELSVRLTNPGEQNVLRNARLHYQTQYVVPRNKPR